MEPYQEEAAPPEPGLNFNQQAQALHVPNMSLVADDHNGIDRDDPGQQQLTGDTHDGDHSPPPSDMNYLGRESSRTPRPGHSLYCQIEDCRAPLAGLKEYHQRYKVCETHLKINYIERGGRKLRFCQQCGRFQPLDEFDSNKRSCRARLQRHNARRRKRPRDSAGGIGGGSPIPPALNPAEIAAMQDAVQFASATLMYTTAHGGLAGDISGLDTSSANAAATIAGLPFGGGLSAMPFVPSRDVMLLLLKGYAGMFHYSLSDHAGLTALAQPTAPHELSMPMEAAAAAAAAMAAVPGAGVPSGVGGVGGGQGPEDTNAVAHLLAIQSQPTVQDTQHAQQGYTELPDVLPYAPSEAVEQGGVVEEEVPVQREQREEEQGGGVREQLGGRSVPAHAQEVTVVEHPANTMPPPP